MDRTVAELLLEQPARSRLFEGLGIDYCCAGKKTLKEACDRKVLSSFRVLELLKALGDLIDHILDAHHQYLRQELPRLGAMLRKVEREEGSDAFPDPESACGPGTASHP